MSNPHPWKPDPNDPRIPIAPPDTLESISVHRDIAALDQQPIKPNQYQFLARILRFGAGQRNGSVKQCVVISHAASIGGAVRGFHSYLSGWLAMSLFFCLPVTNTDKRFYQ